MEYTTEDIQIKEIESPIGVLQICALPDLVTEIHFPGLEKSASNLKRMSENDLEYDIFEEVILYLDSYFKGSEARWAQKDYFYGTSFQKSVWAVTSKIPFGSVLAYGEIAEIIDNPKATRAVGSAMGANPIPILVPCHRVIRGDGSIGGFGGGLEIKRWLLQHEGITLKH